MFSKIKLIALMALTLCTFYKLDAFFLTNKKAFQELDAMARHSGTDKSSHFHGYTKPYAFYFDKIRQSPIRFLEIGIWEGSSVKMWEQYFPNAELHFIDKTSDYVKYSSLRSVYHYIDQENIEALKAFGKEVKGEFDVVIDDGGHTMKQQISSFIALFPFVKSGGVYVIEDLYTSYWEEFGGLGTRENPMAGEGTTVQFLKDRIDSVNASGSKTKLANFDKVSPELLKEFDQWQKDIFSIHFYDGICFIFKR